MADSVTHRKARARSATSPGSHRFACARRGRPNGTGAEHGLSIVELVVAITLLALLFTVMAGVLTNAMMASLFARQNQNAGDLISETIESYRAKGYAALAMDPGDLSGDPAISGGAFNPNAGGPAEPIVALPGGAVKPHIKLVKKGATPFTLASYITLPTDSAGAVYKRVTVRATWFRNGSKHQRQANTFVSLVRNGLPLPNFTFGTPVERTFGAGTKVVLPVKITNRGARDAWNLTATADRPGWIYTWYRDAGNDGILGATDTVLGDSDSNGQTDTGTIETDETVPMLAVYELLAAEAETASDAPVVVTLKAVSSAQPGDANGTKTVVDKVHVTHGCTGCTYRPYFLHTSTDPLVPEVDMPFNPEAPTATSLADYDEDGSFGRAVAPGGSGYGETDAALMSNWLYQMPTATELANGFVSPLKVRIYVSSPSGGTLRLFLRKLDGSSPVADLATKDAALGITSVGSFQLVEVAIPFAATSFTSNERLEFKVESLATPISVAYDTIDHPSSVILPVVSGG